MVDRVGQQLGNYRLVRLIGRGGFAEVYLGEHMRLGTQAAVKVLYARLATPDEVEAFEKEARTIAHLSHPHIVRVFDFDVHDDTPFLVMDYAIGGTLRQRHPRGIVLPLPMIVNYVKQVASALQYAHDEKLIHRDIKPENMLLDKGDTVVLSDFGIALVAQSSRYQSTQEVAGTATYMAPEQFQGKPRRASDQYALGVVVYEWLIGDLPFHGSFSEIASQHLFVPPPPLHGKVSTISPDVERVVLTALEKDPQKRFASVQAFATALEQASQTAPTRPIAPPSELLSPSQLVPPTDTIVAFPSRQLSGPPNAAASIAEPVPVSNLPNSENFPPLPKMKRNSVIASNGQGFHLSRTVLLIGLAMLVMASGIGIYAVSHANQLATINATATTIAQASTTADAPTASLTRTATSAPDPTATAGATKTATSTPDPTATAGATNNDPYPPGTWNLALHDPLSQPNYWNNGSNPAFGGSCQFINGAYHISQSKFGNFFCAPPTITFSNLTVEVKMTIVKGDCGGIWFRGNGPAYFFAVCQDGRYGLYLYASSGEQTLASGPSAAIHTGTNQSNVIAVVANGSTIDLYVNYQKITSVSNSALSSGEINFAAVDAGSDPTEVAYSDARVWTP